MRPPGPWDEGAAGGPVALAPPADTTVTDTTVTDGTTAGGTATAEPPAPATTGAVDITGRTTPAEPPAPAADGEAATPRTVPTRPTRPATTDGSGDSGDSGSIDADTDATDATDATITVEPSGRAAADGGDPPPGPPAPAGDARTAGAGGKRSPAEGEAGTGPAPRRTEGLLLGLAAGDAAGWPAARHRAARMPEWTRRLTRELDTFAEQNATTTLPVPIALNQSPEPLRLGPSDDAEWAAFAAEAVLRAGDDTVLGDLSRQRRMRAAIDLTWNAAASEVAAAADRAPEVESAVLPLRARISVRAGLGNLATGLRPPATGHDNPHYFDDAACVRACVLAVAHPGAPRLAAELAEFDARYTQDGDGVHGARAMAAALSLALAGADAGACAAAALAELPEGTEIGRNARHALALARASESTFALVPLLEHQIVDHVYSYGVAAAETVPVALALAVASGGRIAEAVPAAACLSRVADSAPALAGALTGALGGAASIPATWRAACRTLSGCALPRLTGTDLVELAELLEAAQPAAPGG